MSGYPQDPVVLGDLPGLDPPPNPDCDECMALAKRREELRALGDHAAAAAISELIWRHKCRT